MNKFVFIAPAFNASKTLEQFLLSLAVQTYKNWNLVMIDDMSTDNTYNNAWEIARRLGVAQHVHVIKNTEKLWEVANVLKGIREGHVFDGEKVHPIAPDDIICRIDPDDYLCDADALRIINEVYMTSGCDVLWTKHRWFDDKRITSYNISDYLPDDADPYQYRWVTSHLKTFRKRLIDGVPYENFLNMNGDLVKRCGDQAIYLPVLKRSQKAIYLPLVMYSYKCNLESQTFQTPDAKFQASEAEFIRQRGFISDGPIWESVILGTK